MLVASGFRPVENHDALLNHDHNYRHGHTEKEKRRFWASLIPGRAQDPKHESATLSAFKQFKLDVLPEQSSEIEVGLNHSQKNCILMQISLR